MTEQAYKRRVEKIGGIVTTNGKSIDFPKDYHIKNKADAVELMDLMINDTHNNEQYLWSMDNVLNALRVYIAQCEYAA